MIWSCHSSPVLTSAISSSSSMAWPTGYVCGITSKPAMGFLACSRAVACAVMVRTSWDTTRSPCSAARAKIAGSSALPSPASWTVTTSSLDARRRMPRTIANRNHA